MRNRASYNRTILLSQHVKDLEYLDKFIAEMGRNNIPWQDLASDYGITILEFQQRYDKVQTSITRPEVPVPDWDRVHFSDHLDMLETCFKIIMKLEEQQGIPMPWASIAASSNIQIPSAKVKYNRLKRMVEDARPGRLEPGQQSTNPPATAPLRRSERLSERPPEQRTRFSSEDASD